MRHIFLDNNDRSFLWEELLLGSLLHARLNLTAGRDREGVNCIRGMERSREFVEGF